MTCYPWPYIKLLFSLGAQRLGSASTLQICKQTCLLSSRVFYGFESLQLQPFASISHHPPARIIKLAISNSQTHPNCQLNRALGDSFLVRIVNTQQRLTLFPFVNKQGAGTKSCRPTSRHPKYFSQATPVWMMFQSFLTLRPYIISPSCWSLCQCHASEGEQ